MIIPTHNSEKVIVQCVQSLITQKYPREKFEIIIVDDGSKDKTTSLAKEAGADQAKIVEPCFQGKARNIGAKIARGKILAFLDSDCAANDGWLQTIEKELETNKAIGGPVLNGNNHSSVAWAEYLMEFCGWDEYKKRSIVHFVPGCNQICDKNVFSTSGGFSEERLSEDVLFGHSLEKIGVKTIFVPELQIRHFCRTEKTKYLNNMKLLGKYSTRTAKEVPSIYRKLSKKRLYIPLVFFVKLGARTIRAIRAKKFLKFLSVLPLIIMGTGAYCSGAWSEIGSN